MALIQESLAVAHKTGAIESKDLGRVAVDTTVQPKAVAHPSDARLMHRALDKLVAFAKPHGVALRQSYLRVAKRAAIMVGRYSHAHQFKRARKTLKFLRTRLGRVIRDINRKIKGEPEPEARFALLRDLAVKVQHQDHRQRGQKAYLLHAPEVECIGKGKARSPYEFGCKVSIVTPVTAPKGGQFALHAKALHGNPFDGHTFGPVIADLEKLTGVETRRIHVDKSYRGHNHPEKFRVWISGQVDRVTAVIRREMKRRAAVEPVIGHVKAEHRMQRNYLKGRQRSHQRHPRCCRPGRARLAAPRPSAGASALYAVLLIVGGLVGALWSRSLFSSAAPQVRLSSNVVSYFLCAWLRPAGCPHNGRSISTARPSRAPGCFSGAVGLPRSSSAASSGRSARPCRLSPA